MNAENMPIANQEKLNQQDCSNLRNQGDLYSQNGKHGIGHNSGGVIKDNAKIAGKYEENNKNQSQNTNNQVNVNINTSSESNSLKKQENLIDSQKTIEMYIKEGDKEASIKTPYSAENFQSLLGFLQQRFNDNSLGYEDIKKSSIKLIIKGSENGLKRIAESFASGELAPLLKHQFNLELEDAKFIESDSPENYQINQNQKLLAFTIAGNVSQTDIGILKDALIDTSDDDEIEQNEEKSRSIKEIRTQGAKGKDLRSADLRDTSEGEKKQKITYIATAEGVETAEKALKRLGFESKTNFAKSILMSRSTVTKFFGRKSIQLDSFQRICEKLTLDWREIADLPAEESLTPVTINRESSVLVADEDMRSI